MTDCINFNLLKDWPVLLKRIGYLIYYIWQKPQRLRLFIRYGLISGVQVQINHEKKLVYVLNPKVGTTTITFYLAGRSEPEIRSAKSHVQKQRLLGITHLVDKKQLSALQAEGYFVFSFVRNPYARIVSFFKNKYVLQEDGLYRSQDFAQNLSLKKVKDFDEVVTKIHSIPDSISDTHFMSQTSVLYQGSDGGFNYDFIGKLESFEEDFRLILDKVEGVVPVWQNKTSANTVAKLHEFISPELEALIYDRFQEDFERFSYPRITYKS
jgi:hypothetical protein